ncbi:MAG: galactitol-1-phosphate 5-dehydrogenase [Acidobacteria bacterium]|nr:MAG: galactitol-1-phosphate 5-dehydrogenase [Acidobacteriota bacterium]
MKALVLKAYGQLEVQDVPPPGIGPRDVLVRVMACGICGSDVHGMDGSTGRRIPPIVMGHEAAGLVERVGDQVTSFSAGDRVTFDSTIYNPESFFSRRGQVNLCDDRRVLGVSCEDYRQNGAFAELVAVPSHILYSLPPGMTFEQAAMVEPVSIAVHARNLTPIEGGDTALVFGTGLIGLMMVQVLRHTPVARIVAVDVDDARLALAAELGADHVLNSAATDVPAAVRALTGGRGADVAFEAVGLEATVRAAVLAVRKGGSVTLIGNLAKEVSLPLQAVVTRQIRLQGSCASSGEYPECLELIASGKVKVDRFISAIAPLEEGPRWFDRLHRREPGLLKVLLKPNP